MSLLKRLFGPGGDSSRPLAFGPNGVVTLGQLRKDVAGWQRALGAHDLRRWALCFEDTYHFVSAFCAVLLDGREVVLFDHTRPGSHAELAAHYDGVLLDHPQPLPESVPALPFIAGRDGAGAYVPAADDGTVRLFTSGSTGEPKPIVKAFSQIVTEVQVLRTLMGDRVVGSEVVSTVAHQHFYGLIFRVFLPLACDAVLARDTLQVPEQVLAACTGRRVLVSSPALLKRLDGPAAQGAFTLVLSAGGKLPAAAADASARLLGCRPTEIFGTSETGAIAWRSPTEDDTPWQPLPGVEVIADEEGRLRLRSPYVDPENWFACDDRIALFADGRFRLEGRLDRVLKIEEKRISLDEIERCLQALPEVREAAALALTLSNRVVVGAVVVLSDEGEAAATNQQRGRFALALRRALRQSLEPMAIPRRFRFVEQIPVNPQGKRLTADLKRLFE